jgi:hypothetical protein
MVSDADKTEYYANRGKYRFIKIENDQFTVYVYGHEKKQFDKLADAVKHRDSISK